MHTRRGRRQRHADARKKAPRGRGLQPANDASQTARGRQSAADARETFGGFSFSATVPSCSWRHNAAIA